MTHLCFIDETGTDSNSSHYSIGALIIPYSYYPAFLKLVKAAKSKYNFPHEIKWSKVHKNYSLINLGLYLLYEILNCSKLSYQCITVEKQSYNKWSTLTKDEAFYITLTQLITKSAELIGDNLIVKCDKKNDRYDKHHEVCQIISNYFLHENQLTEVQKNNIM